MPFRVLEHAQPISTGEDVARSSATGLGEGIAAVPGILGDLPQMAKGLMNRGMKFATDHGVNGGQPVDMSQAPDMNGGTGSLLSVLSSAVAKRTGADPRMARLATALMSPAGMMDAPTTSEIVGAANKDKPLYQPQTKAGEYAHTIAQFAPAATMPGGAMRRVANVAIPGAASETAGQMTKGKPYEKGARIAAALLAGGGLAMTGRGGPSDRMLSEASRGATDAQVGEARQLMERAQGQGVQLTMAEALQQVTNTGTGMGRLQRVIEGTKAGSERTGPMMAQRPAQVRNAATQLADALAPPTDRPSMIGRRAQEGAQGALDSTRQDINALARPHYEAMGGTMEPVPPSPTGVAGRVYKPGTLIPEEMYQPLRHNSAYQQALRETLGDSVLGSRLKGLPDTDLAVVNEVVKQLDRQALAEAQTVANPGGNNAKAAAFTSARGVVDEIAAKVSPDWREARDIVSMGRRGLLEPMEAGPLGRVAATDDVKAQTAALFPSQPIEGASRETAAAMRNLGQDGSSIGANLTRQHLMNSMNESTQDLQGGMNQYGGAKWAAAIAGNPEQERTLMAGVEGAGGDRGRLADLLETMRATGQRQPPGSLTAYNTRALEELGNPGAAGEVLRTGLNPPGVFRRLGQMAQDWQTETNAGRLAEALIANPAQAEQILMRARRVVPPGQALQTIERLALTAQSARQPAQPQQLPGQ